MKKNIKEKCGLFGIYNVDGAAELMYYGLHALQHRGQEGCGMVTTDGRKMHIIKGEGLIVENFDEKKIHSLTGRSGIGHVMAGKDDGAEVSEIQPFIFKHQFSDFAIAHNGSVVNFSEIREKLERSGHLFHSYADAELFAQLIIENLHGDFTAALVTALRQMEGGFSFLVMTPDKIYAVRDKHGLRPLSLGRINGGYVLASETCAFNIIGASFERDLIPGEILILSADGCQSLKYSNFSHRYLCAMEFAYFARPDSNLEELNVHTFRRASGKALAVEHPAPGDIVVGVPDSSISAAMGYAEATGFPYEIGLIKNRYIARTFIQPSRKIREKAVKLKLSSIASVVRGKRVVLVDDSIVRGTTCRRIVALLKEAGAVEVHVRIATPQITHPCFYGVDFTTYEEIIGAFNSKEQIRQAIGADSLEYLSLERFYQACGRSELCTACFTGKYPTNIYQALKEANKIRK